MKDTIVRFGTLTDFLAEIIAPSRLRLDSVERWKPGAIHPLPTKTVQLHLQGFNDLGELCWLMESHNIVWVQGKPSGPIEQSIFDSVKTSRRLAREYLESLGYLVRPGTYGLPQDVEPISGVFDCIRWTKDDDGWSVALAPGEEDPHASS